MSKTKSKGGRHFLLSHNGRVYHKPEPCYLMTETEATEAAMELRAIYGGDYKAVDMKVEPTCEHSYPGNGSHCEKAHGHGGLCAYLETRHNKRITWKHKS